MAIFGRKDKKNTVIRRVVVAGERDRSEVPPPAVEKRPIVTDLDSLPIGDRNVRGEGGDLVLLEHQRGACIVFHPQDSNGEIAKDAVIIGIDPNVANYPQLKVGVKSIIESIGLKVQDILDVSPTVVQEFNAGDVSTGNADAPEVRRLFDEMVMSAYRKNASDISILVDGGRSIQVRIKVHGEWQLAKSLVPGKQGNELLRSLVSKSGINDADYQSVGVDYNYETSILGQGFLLRCSDMKNGSDVDNRVFTARIKAVGAMSESKSIADLGYCEEVTRALEDMMTRTNSAFFFTGATGSGKTTSINACGDYYLRVYTDPGTGERRRLMTVQDPIEREFPGMPNIELSGTEEEIKARLKQVNKLFLRHAPDAIIYSEVRDADMLTRMMELARTGHLVGSTIHTTDWAMFFPRIEEDFGLSVRSLLRSNLLLFLMSQTLLSEPCPQCSHTHAEAVTNGLIDEAVAVRMAGVFGDAVSELRYHVFTEQACPRCSGSGIIGRNPAYEMFIFDEDANGDVLDLVRDGRYYDAYRLWANKPSDGITGEPIANRVFRLAVAGKADARSALSQIQGRIVSDHLKAEYGLLDRGVKEVSDG